MGERRPAATVRNCYNFGARAQSHLAAVALRTSLWHSAPMTAIGRPFAKGDDERRYRGGRSPGQTARTLARACRGKTVAALEALRDAAVDEKVRLEAAKVLLAYSDGEPGVHNVPTEADEKASDSGELAQVLELLKADAMGAQSPPRVGGDAGSPSEGEGGEA